MLVADEQENTDPGLGEDTQQQACEKWVTFENIHVNYISPTEKIKFSIALKIGFLSPQSFPQGLIVLQTRDSQDCQKAIPLNHSISYRSHHTHSVHIMDKTIGTKFSHI